MRNYIFTIFSAILLTIPIGYPNLYFVAWFALLPFLYAIMNDTPRTGFKKGCLLGIIIFVRTTYWLYYPIVNYSGLSSLFCIIILIVFFILLGFIYGIWAWVYLFVNNKNSSPVWLAVSWTGIEYLRYQILHDFPFSFLGYTQVDFSLLLQLADFGGVFVISFIILLFNGYLFKFFLEKNIKIYIPLIVIFIFVITYGGLRINQYKDKEYNIVKVGIVQTNLSPTEKWLVENIDSNLEYLLGQSKKLAEADLIIWPESALTFDLIRNEYYRNRLINGLEDINSYIQAGSLAIIDDISHKYNSSFLISPDGKIINRYNKMKLVPFGEYMPLSGLVELLTNYTMVSEVFGNDAVIFKTKFAQWRTAICSEILNPSLIQENIEQTDFLVNQTNEGWYLKGNLQEQMWTAAVFRAVENRRSVVKVGNYSYGGVITPLGESRKKIFANKQNIISCQVEKNREKTYYQKWGDFFGYLSLGITILLLFIKIILYKRIS